MKKLMIVLIGLMGLAVFTACETEIIKPVKLTPLNPQDTVKFSKDIEPLFTNYNCINCHNGSFKFNLNIGYAYNSLKSGGYINKPSATSLLILQLNSNPPHNGADKFTALQKQKISAWIDAGALDN